MKQNIWPKLTLVLGLALVAALLILPPWPWSPFANDATIGAPNVNQVVAATTPRPTPTQQQDVVVAASARPTPTRRQDVVSTSPAPNPTPPPREIVEFNQQEVESDSESLVTTLDTPSDGADFSLEELILATKDSVWNVRWNAVNALGVLED